MYKRAPKRNHKFTKGCSEQSSVRSPGWMRNIVCDTEGFRFGQDPRLCNLKKCRVPQGAFERVVKIICKKYNLETREIDIKTILSRTKPGWKLKVKHKGTDSPMAALPSVNPCHVQRDWHLLTHSLRECWHRLS
jgi:hypothetical protein